MHAQGIAPAAAIDPMFLVALARLAMELVALLRRCNRSPEAILARLNRPTRLDKVLVRRQVAALRWGKDNKVKLGRADATATRDLVFEMARGMTTTDVGTAFAALPPDEDSNEGEQS